VWDRTVKSKTQKKMSQQPLPNDLKLLKERMNLIAAADPNQKQNEFSLIRYLRAFKDVDSAFKVNFTFNISSSKVKK